MIVEVVNSLGMKITSGTRRRVVWWKFAEVSEGTNPYIRDVRGLKVVHQKWW